jgi:hypothetical protein
LALGKIPQTPATNAAAQIKTLRLMKPPEPTIDEKFEPV